MTTPFLLRDIRWDEAPGGAPVLTAYPDPVSHADPWTIGFGHTGPEVVKGLVWTPEQCEAALASDTSRAQRALDYAMPWWRSLCDARQDVLCNMCFNMGIGRLEGFHHTLAAVQAHNYGVAADQMLLSAWAAEVHGRATRLAEQMRVGLRAPQPGDSHV